MKKEEKINVFVGDKIVMSIGDDVRVEMDNYGAVNLAHRLAEAANFYSDRFKAQNSNGPIHHYKAGMNTACGLKYYQVAHSTFIDFITCENCKKTEQYKEAQNEQGRY